MSIVAIDAGHAARIPCNGQIRTREKDVVLAIARALKKRIDAEPGMRAMLTGKPIPSCRCANA